MAEVCFTLYNNRVYCHISGKSKAFVGGMFDVSMCKSITLGEDEVFLLKSMLGYDQYSTRQKLVQQRPQHVSISFVLVVDNLLSSKQHIDNYCL